MSETKITLTDIGTAVKASPELQKAYAASAVATFVAKCNPEHATKRGARKGAGLADALITPEVVATAKATERTPADVLTGLLAMCDA